MFFAPAIRTARFVPRAYDRSLERFVNDAFSAARRSLNVEQDDKTWTLTLDVPGLAREDLTHRHRRRRGSHRKQGRRKAPVQGRL